MGFYSDDHAVEDMVLTIINDGNGSMCGVSYQQRCEAATHVKNGGLLVFRAAAREYGRYSYRRFGTPHPTLQQTSAAGNILRDYYAEHVLECARVSA